MRDRPRHPTSPRVSAAATAAIGIVIALRMLTLLPPVIDDDEAWFAIAGHLGKSLAEALTAVIDNKPPGTAWYYWAIARITGPDHLIQWARLAQGVLFGLTAYLISRMATRTRKETALALLLALGATGPKIFAVTNEGLMIPWIVLALWLVWPAGEPRFARAPLRAALSGGCMAAVILIKQSGILFLLPWLLAVGGGASLASALAGLFSCLAAGIAQVDPSFFWQMAFVYPASVLTSARERLFPGWKEVLPSLVPFVIALLPFLSALPRALGSAWKDRKHRAQSVTLAWLLSAIGAILLGKGLFLHYYLLAIPPICLLVSGLGLFQRPGKRAWLWLGTAYAISVCTASIGATGVFWGNDLAYFERLAVRVRSVASPQSKVFVWGGSAIPLALSGHPTLTGFPNARFAMPPYTTPALQRLFLERFEAEAPELILDLHARSDNLFNYPLDTLPQVAARISRDYVLWVDPSLPWARFYLRRDASDSGTDPDREGLCRGKDPHADCTPHPKSLALLGRLLSEATGSLRGTQRGLREWAGRGRLLRASFAWEWSANACQRVNAPLAGLSWEAVRKGDEDSVAQAFRLSGYGAPYALEAPLWWVSLAVVELQPSVVPRDPPCE